MLLLNWRKVQTSVYYRISNQHSADLSWQDPQMAQNPFVTRLSFDWRSADAVFLSCFTSPLITPTCSGGFPSIHRWKGDVTAVSLLVVSCRAPLLASLSLWTRHECKSIAETSPEKLEINGATKKRSDFNILAVEINGPRRLWGLMSVSPCSPLSTGRPAAKSPAF